MDATEPNHSSVGAGEDDASKPAQEDVAQLVESVVKSSKHSKQKTLDALRAELVTVEALQQRWWIISFFLWVIAPNTIVFILLPTAVVLGSMAMTVKLSLGSALEGETCMTAWIPHHDQVGVPPQDCSFCVNITEARRVSNLSQEEFFTKYAYSGIPIVVTDATDKWKARELFSYQFFKRLYFRNPKALEKDGIDGQFFAYRSDIDNLFQLFNMSEERSNLEGGKKWYIGWSTDNPVIGKQLKKYFSTPYFIHPQSDEESLKVSWIFMGSPGPGAFMHIDQVMHSSWQAQLKGVKTWTVAPQPECEAVCAKFNITVNTGDMIVINTNVWYHSTYIHPGSISITIGNEFE